LVVAPQFCQHRIGLGGQGNRHLLLIAEVLEKPLLEGIQYVFAEG